MIEDGIVRRASSHAGQPYLQLWNLLEIACCTWPKSWTELARLSRAAAEASDVELFFPRHGESIKVARFVLHRLNDARDAPAPPNGEGSDNKLSKRSHPAKPLVGAHDAAQV